LGLSVLASQVQASGLRWLFFLWLPWLRCRGPWHSSPSSWSFRSVSSPFRPVGSPGSACLRLPVLAGLVLGLDVPALLGPAAVVLAAPVLAAVALVIRKVDGRSTVAPPNLTPKGRRWKCLRRPEKGVQI